MQTERRSGQTSPGTRPIKKYERSEGTDKGFKGGRERPGGAESVCSGSHEKTVLQGEG